MPKSLKRRRQSCRSIWGDLQRGGPAAVTMGSKYELLAAMGFRMVSVRTAGSVYLRT